MLDVGVAGTIYIILKIKYAHNLQKHLKYESAFVFLMWLILCSNFFACRALSRALSPFICISQMKKLRLRVIYTKSSGYPVEKVNLNSE